LTDPGFPPGTPLQKFLEWQRAKSVGLDDATIDAMVEPILRARWFVVIDDELHVEPGIELCHQTRSGRAQEDYCSYFTVEFVASLFPDAQVLPPVSPEWQHCCILSRD
jgi:hypothetical protein